MAPETGGEATARPWQVGNPDRNDQATVKGGDGSLVAVVAHECVLSRLPVMEANADLIVRAVNAHDALVAALRAMRLAHFRDRPDCTCREYDDAERALALAEGDSPAGRP